jgi:hypothetical protein
LSGVKFQTGEHTLSYKGKVLYENRDVKSSLAFLLYKDGLRELRFTKELEEHIAFEFKLQDSDFVSLRQFLDRKEQFVHSYYPHEVYLKKNGSGRFDLLFFRDGSGR